jgi:subtilisin family serine protease
LSAAALAGALPAGPGRFIVTLADQPTSGPEPAGGTVRAPLTVGADLPAGGGQVVDVAAGRALVDADNMAVAAAALAGLGDVGVLAVEPDQAVVPAADPLAANGSMWHLGGPVAAAGVPAATSGVNAAGAWAQSTFGTAGTVVAVVDTGIDVTHPDVAPALWRNPGEVPGNGRDDDGNGLVDDVSGWDFVNGDASVFDPGDDSHGTAAAGMAVGPHDNRVGGGGVAPLARLLPVKALAPDSTLWEALNAMDYVVDLVSRHRVEVAAMNLSWTVSRASANLDTALLDAAKAGIVVVAATGNQAVDLGASPRYPAASTCTHAGRPCVLSVAATTRTGELAPFSNFGATAHVAAPGTEIVAPAPGGRWEATQGTSFSAPQVAGVVALCAGLQPTATLAQRRDAVTATSRPRTALYGKVAHGLVDAQAAATRCRGMLTFPEVTTPAWLPPATQGRTYLAAFTAHGGTTPYRWEITAGLLPEGLTMSTTGVVLGTPPADLVGPSAVVVKVTAANGLSASALVGLQVRVLPDVPNGVFYEDAVAWALRTGVTTGIGSPPVFAPNVQISRAQFTTMLWRFAGSPDPGAVPQQFGDVPVGSYYDVPVRWATTVGVTKGVSATAFGPHRTVDRAQVATMMWRLAGSPPTSGAGAFTDVPAGAFFAQAVGWMVTHNVTSGTSATTFSPYLAIPRSQAVTFLWRSAGAPAAWEAAPAVPQLR